jgi:hypothetical protein
MTPVKTTASLKRPPDYPANITYSAFTWPEVQKWCSKDTWAVNHFGAVPEREKLSDSNELFHRLKAYWTMRGAADPGGVAMVHSEMLLTPNPAWEAECIASGWCSGIHGFPKSLRDLEQRYLPPVIPNALTICTRCPVFCEAYETGGSTHPEPLWFGLLKITSKCKPDISIEVSDGHAKYTLEELTHRLNRIEKEQLKPSSCSYLAEHSTLCNGCEWRGYIKSPIALGYANAPNKIKGAL